jgi:hypothetical protein
MSSKVICLCGSVGRAPGEVDAFKNYIIVVGHKVSEVFSQNVSQEKDSIECGDVLLP